MDTLTLARQIEAEISSVVDRCEHGFHVLGRCPMGCDEERVS